MRHTMFRRCAYYGTALAATGMLGMGGFVAAESHKPAHLLSEAEVSALLQERELQGRDKYTRFDFSEVPSLGEDGNCQGTVGEYRCWGIFDGHSGWSASTHVSNHVIAYLRDAYKRQLDGPSSPWGWLTGSGKPKTDLSSHEFDAVISEAFAALDEDMLQGPLRALKTGDYELAGRVLPVAFSGACAMMAFYHPIQQLLKVALVGDSRTVLGVQDTDGVWHARALTTDLTGENPAEIARIQAEHPKDPPGFLSNGRVLGYQPSRTFGDALGKYSFEQQKQLRRAFWTVRLKPQSRTPPYLTAKPVISTVQINPKRPSFIVMGCDGLYEWLTNEQVVSLVGQWLDKNPVIPCKSYAGVKDDSNLAGKQLLRPRVLRWGPLEPIVKDDNAGTHVIRNALGGADLTKVSMLLSIPTGMSRSHRDDITCTVVFFYPESSAKL